MSRRSLGRGVLGFRTLGFIGLLVAGLLPAATCLPSLLADEPAGASPAQPSTAPLSEAALIEAGREQFTRLRHSGPPADSPLAAHPMFNARSCAECHRQGGIGGGGPKENNVRLVSPEATTFNPLVARVLGVSGKVAVLPRHSLAPEYESWLADHLYEGGPASHILKFDEFLSVGTVGERNTPPLFGIGLLATIPQSEIDAVAAGQPKEIRGRSPRLKEGGFGRFGWKADTSTLYDFNEGACAVELGLTTPKLRPSAVRSVDITHKPGTTPAMALGSAGEAHRSLRALFLSNFVLASLGQKTSVRDPAGSIAGSDRPTKLDMSQADVEALTRFVASLPRPRQVIDPAKRERVAEGERHFHAIGCAVCHVPDLGGVTGVYSDLLMHGIGTTGSGYYGSGPPPEKTPQGDFVFAPADTFRTPPLWGVADSAPYMSNGSAATLDGAITRHGIQAFASTRAYQVLGGDKQKALITFLESLRAPQ